MIAAMALRNERHFISKNENYKNVRRTENKKYLYLRINAHQYLVFSSVRCMKYTLDMQL